MAKSDSKTPDALRRKLLALSAAPFARLAPVTTLSALPPLTLLSGESAALPATSSAPSPASSRTQPVPRWDETHEVIVVGSGFAGLAAAIEAAGLSKDVLLIEKMESPGGNSAISSGDFAAPGTRVQKRLGIADSPELMARDLLAAGRVNDPARCRALAQRALPASRWLEEELGVRFEERALQWDAGQSVPRGLQTRPRSGYTIVSAEIDAALRRGVVLRTRTLLEQILRDASGRAAGLWVREGYRFPDEDSGTPKRIRARRGIVLATGGFGADVAYRSKWNPRLGAWLQTTNQPGATGEALEAARLAGCALRDMARIQVLPWISADELSLGRAWAFIEHGAAATGIWVTEKGARFLNERGGQRERADQMLPLLEKGSRIFGITTAAAAGRNPGASRSPVELSELVSRGIVREYPTLSALAATEGISPAGLAASVSDFNRAIAEGKAKDAFGRPLSGLKPLDAGPWLAVRIQPKVHHCMGGIAADAGSRALDPRGRPVPGLFVAGECAAGTFGEGRIPSHSATDAIVFGRIAGRAAAGG